MEDQINTEHTVPVGHFKRTLHSIFAHWYFLYFLLFILGVILDLVYPIKIFDSSFMSPLGFLLLVVATFIIFWEQKTPKKLDAENVTKESFCKGPYCYTRHPGHWGLFLLVLGFGIIANAFFIIFLTIVSFIMTKLIYLRKHELVLTEKYGAPYEEYKKAVKF